MELLLVWTKRQCISQRWALMHETEPCYPPEVSKLPILPTKKSCSQSMSSWINLFQAKPLLSNSKMWSPRKFLETRIWPSKSIPSTGLACVMIGKTSSKTRAATSLTPINCTLNHFWTTRLGTTNMTKTLSSFLHQGCPLSARKAQRSGTRRLEAAAMSGGRIHYKLWVLSRL